MTIISELASICKDLRLLGETELTKDALCAFAAITDTEHPRADLSYSYVMRKLRKGDTDRRLKFQKAFKIAFDRALYEDVDEPAEIALMVAMKAINFKDEDAS
ncbi:hypothetical protein M0R72_02135 [Candidatus Pacearchaeota archaeon]|jgi:hypothetical protein|nr:hypothetical protein [Candidatus Pacearchaeota archaeon]